MREFIVIRHGADFWANIKLSELPEISMEKWRKLIKLMNWYENHESVLEFHRWFPSGINAAKELIPKREAMYKTAKGELKLFKRDSPEYEAQKSKINSLLRDVKIAERRHKGLVKMQKVFEETPHIQEIISYYTPDGEE